MRVKRLRWWSVLLLYPGYISDGTETFYAHALATSRNKAVANARRQMAAENEWSGADNPIRDPADIEALLVLKGRHWGV
jgi:hypothetical protein